MTIRRLLREEAFAPDEVAVLTAAYDHCIGRLMLRDRDDKVTELLAQKIIEAAKSGERDPSRLCHRALEAMGSRH